MASAIENHDIVVEIGCGTGYSTLSLIENGHRVIAIEKNKDCIEKAKRLLQSRNVDKEKIVFLEGGYCRGGI
ncbi:MAG: methyltransferase domain-containing protein [Lachnospiraceae bacterium]|nr:methyltransferase domain-containing protein [Lachnospiraceae bacterium]